MIIIFVFVCLQIIYVYLQIILKLLFSRNQFVSAY